MFDFASFTPTTDIGELLLRSQLGAVQKFPETSHPTRGSLHAGQVRHLFRHLPLSRYLLGHQGKSQHPLSWCQLMLVVFCFTSELSLLCLRSRRSFSRERSATALILTWHWRNVTLQRYVCSYLIFWFASTIRSRIQIKLKKKTFLPLCSSAAYVKHCGCSQW